MHVIGLIGVGGHERVQAVLESVTRVQGLPEGRLLFVVQRQVVVHATHHQERFNVVFKSPVCHTAFGCVRQRASQLLGAHLLVRDRLDDLGAGDEHVRAVFDHENKIRHGGRVNGAPGGRTHDHTDLRNDA